MFSKIFYKQLGICVWLTLSLVTFSIVSADDGLVVTPIAPNEDLGISGINGDLEIAHVNELVYGDVLTSNYQQAKKAGINWSRWLIRWDFVEQTPGNFMWAKPSDFNYIDLARTDDDWGVNQVIILNEIPEFYKVSAQEDLIVGIMEDVFLTTTGTTNDPSHPDIQGINPANKWAMFFYQAASNFSPAYWQIMNELNINPAWDTDPLLGEISPGRGAFIYVHLLTIANKVIQYLGSDAKLIVGGLVYTFDESTGNKLGPSCPSEDITLNKWAEQMLCYLESEIGNDPTFEIVAIALHSYERSKTSHDFPAVVADYMELINMSGQHKLANTPIWLTESGSNACPEEPLSPSHPFYQDLYEVCVERSANPPHPRSSADEQGWYLIQNIAYSYAEPTVVRHYQFSLHDGCAHGPFPADIPGFGLYRNWADFDILLPNHKCAITGPGGFSDGAEKPAYQAFLQATIFLRDFTGYATGVGTDPDFEFLPFPTDGDNLTHVTWNRQSNQNLSILLSPSLSGGPILLVYPNGRKEIKYPNVFGVYKITLPKATNPQTDDENGYPIIGGQPFIILEHVLLDFGPTLAIFRAGHQTGTIRFGLNLPQTGTPSPITFTIQDESGQVVKEAILPAPTGNGQYNLSWDGRDQTSNQLVTDGLYTYQIALAIDTTPYQVSGVIGVSKPNQLLACFFNELYQDFPPSDPPSHLFRTFVTSSLLSEANFITGPGFPPAGINSSKWSVRLAAYLNLNGNAADVYRFKLLDVNDAARLFVDGVMVTSTDWVQQTGELPPTTGPGLYLSPGLHTVLVEHTQVAGTAGLNLIVEKRVDLSADQWQAIAPQWWLPGSNFAATCRRENPVQQPPNGGFEEGLTAWTELSDPDLDSDWQLSTLAYTGLQSVQGVALSPSGLGGGAELISSQVAVEAGDCYRFSLFGRSNNNAGTDFGALAFVEWSTGASYGFDAAWPGQSEWERVERNLVAPAGATTVQLRFLLTTLDRATTNFDATIWLDQIQIEAQDPANC